MELLRGPRGQRGPAGSTKDVLFVGNAPLTIQAGSTSTVFSTGISNEEIFKGILFVKVSSVDESTPGIRIYLIINSEHEYTRGTTIYNNPNSNYAQICIPVTGNVFTVSLENILQSQINVDCSLLGTIEQVTNKFYLSDNISFDTDISSSSLQFGGFNGTIPAGSNVMGNIELYDLLVTPPETTEFVITDVNGDIVFEFNSSISGVRNTENFYVPFDFITQTDLTDGFLFTIQSPEGKYQSMWLFFYIAVVAPQT